MVSVDVKHHVYLLTLMRFGGVGVGGQLARAVQHSRRLECYKKKKEKGLLPCQPDRTWGHLKPHSHRTTGLPAPNKPCEVSLSVWLCGHCLCDYTFPTTADRASRWKIRRLLCTGWLPTTLRSIVLGLACFCGSVSLGRAIHRYLIPSSAPSARGLCGR